jgi:hypothetical protein
LANNLACVVREGYHGWPEVCIWPIAANLTFPDEVRFQGRSQQDLLVASITARDASPTLAFKSFGGIVPHTGK